MRSRIELISKWASFLLAAVLLAHLARWLSGKDRLVDSPISSGLEEFARAATSKQSSRTNTLKTDPISAVQKPSKGTNATSNQASKATNKIALSNTESAKTNLINDPSKTTNVLSATKASGTNKVSAPTLPPDPSMMMAGGPPPMEMPMGMPPGMLGMGMPMGMPMMGRGNPRGSGNSTLPPLTQVKVEKIRDSEILGPVPRPVPMGLLGIAGKDVLFRAPSGQTGLMREGEEMGGVKLLQIGINRILIEHEGQKKELMLHTGFGSETLMPSGKDPKK